MKQIVAVLVFTALAAVTFVVVRTLNESPDAPSNTGAPGATGPAGGSRPPQSPSNTGSRTITNAQGQEVTVSSSIADAIDAAAAFDWAEAAHGDGLVRMADRWSVDLSGVDFDADVLVRYEGGEVTRDEFRRAAITRLAAPMLDAIAAVKIGSAMARARGVEPRLMSQALKDERFARWCAARGVDANMGMILLASGNQLPGDLSRRFFDIGADAALVALSGVEPATPTTSTEVATTVPVGVTAASVDSLLASLNEGWAAVGDHEGEFTEEHTEAITKVLVALDQLALLRVATVREQVAKQVWTHIDRELPEGMVAGVATGELADGVAPWEAGAGVEFIAIDEIWDDLEANFLPHRFERVLEEYLYFDVLRTRLQEAGTYPEDVAAWTVWTDMYDEASRTLMGMRFLNIEVLGYPNLPYYREMTRLVRSFEAMQPEGWQAEDAMREYYSRNRFLIENWRAATRIALFPAASPDAPFERPDFERSLQEAQAMRARVDEGEDFDTLLAEHYEDLSRRYQEARGESVATEFSLALRGGQLTDSIAELMKVLRESYYTRLLHGVSVVYNGVFELKGESVSEPWRSPLGYVLVDVQSASMSGLEREFEDAEFQTRHFHRDASFVSWATGVMRNLTLDVTRGS